MRRLTVVLVSVVGVALACSSDTQSTADLVLGAIYPVSGSQAQGGREELAGVRAALNVAQQSGGGGRRVRLQAIDAVSPQGAADAVDRLVDQYHVAGIVGTYGSTLAQAAADRAERRHIFYLETGAVADPVTAGHRYVFRTVATGGNLGRTAVRFTAEELLPAAGLQPGAARAVIVHVADVYGRSVAAGQADQAATAGIPVVDVIAYDPLAFDAAGLVRRVAGDRADYLWDVSYLDDGVAIWRAVMAAGLPLRGAVGTSSAFCMPAFGQRLGTQAVGVFAADKPDDTVNEAALGAPARALLERARTAYRKVAGTDAIPIGGVAGFVGGWTLFHDILPAVHGPVSPESLRLAAGAVDVPLGAEINGGGVRFAPEGSADAGQNQRAAVVVGQWQAGVEMKVVYPAVYASAALVAPSTGHPPLTPPPPGH